mmetsp:Transcript_59408/g.181232  ORF Transcript_59408/g.181232 Transcript_59408/m.181232 type:complete len:216 (-) Transcript_59408:2141-2788(-)
MPCSRSTTIWRPTRTPPQPAPHGTVSPKQLQPAPLAAPLEGATGCRRSPGRWRSQGPRRWSRWPTWSRRRGPPATKPGLPMLPAGGVLAKAEACTAAQGCTAALRAAIAATAVSSATVTSPFSPRHRRPMPVPTARTRARRCGRPRCPSCLGLRLARGRRWTSRPTWPGWRLPTTCFLLKTLQRHRRGHQSDGPACGPASGWTARTPRTRAAPSP